MSDDHLPTPGYLLPYAEAIEALGPSFRSLLFASRPAQERRFETIHELVGLGGRRIADMGSGRSDLAMWMRAHAIEAATYVGVEGLPAFSEAARELVRSGELHADALVQADFVADIELVSELVAEHQIDTLVFSGSLNTLDEDLALAALDVCWRALEGREGACLVFNFLVRPRGFRLPPTRLPRRSALIWLDWALGRTPEVGFRQGYLGGHDATIAMRRPRI